MINTLSIAMVRSSADKKEGFLTYPSLFKELAELNICVPENDRFYAYFSISNFECIVLKKFTPQYPTSPV